MNIEARRAQLEQAARSAGMRVSTLGHISEADAAALLDRAPGTLANWRAQLRPIPFHRMGGHRGRVSYDLTDLAEFLESGRID